MDDLCLFSDTFEGFLQTVEDVLDRLIRDGWVAKASKCVFLAEEFSFLGHVVSNGTIRPNPKKIEAITEFPRPTDHSAMRRFLGMTGFYRRFINDYAAMADPLFQILSGSKVRKNAPITGWTDVHQK